MPPRLTNRRIEVPLWILSAIFALVSSVTAWAITDRIQLEGEKSSLLKWVEQVDARLIRMEERVDQIYELNYRRANSEEAQTVRSR